MADYASDAEYIQVKIEADDSIWVEDVQTVNEADLRVQLRTARENASQGAGVMVLGDAGASHGAAVTVFDACADVKLDNVRFGVQDREQTE